VPSQNRSAGLSTGRRPAAARQTIAQPTSNRGQRTRALLLVAGRQVFERDGFFKARIHDITALAGAAHGSFYTYFATKEDIFREVASELQRTMFAAVPDPLPDEDQDPVARIDRVNRRYFLDYEKNLALLHALDEVATFNAEFRAIRQAHTDAFIDRATRQLQQLQDEGSIARDVSAHNAAVALTGMVSRYAYYWFVEKSNAGSGDDFERVMTDLTLLCARAIRLPGDDWLKRQRAPETRRPAKRKARAR
jgi:AcrR family transcriptional regulator